VHSFWGHYPWRASLFFESLQKISLEFKIKHYKNNRRNLQDRIIQLFPINLFVVTKRNKALFFKKFYIPSLKVKCKNKSLENFLGMRQSSEIIPNKLLVAYLPTDQFCFSLDRTLTKKIEFSCATTTHKIFLSLFIVSMTTVRCIHLYR